MKKGEKNIIAFVMNLPEGVLESVRAYEKKEKKKFRIMLIWDSRIRRVEPFPEVDIILKCDLSKSNKITEALLPFQKELLAITSRYEQHASRFAAIIPHVPYLRTSSAESLRWATDKFEMRRKLRIYNPKITPKFTLVKENSKTERARVTEKIGFPMIVKPANLAGSLFVTVCYHEEDFEKTLRTSFRKLRKAYEKDRRLESPRIIVEGYMEGDIYSIDSYVNSRGVVYHCPLVRQVTAKNIGHDDFYNYTQMTPTALKKPSIEKAELVAEQAIHALGLKSTTAHVELMKIDDEWKVIEIGARTGGFRALLYGLSCNIDHHMNDILIRIPKKPIIPKKCQGYSVALKWFAPKQGKIVEMKGIKKIKELKSFHSININKKVGDRAVFAREGGRSIFNVFLYNEDRSKLLADIRRLEQLIKITIK